jgi:hypothetical protein
MTNDEMCLVSAISVFIPKGLWHIAQGSPRTRATLGCVGELSSTLKGLRPV